MIAITPWILLLVTAHQDPNPPPAPAPQPAPVQTPAPAQTPVVAPPTGTSEPVTAKPAAQEPGKPAAQEPAKPASQEPEKSSADKQDPGKSEPSGSAAHDADKNGAEKSTEPKSDTVNADADKSLAPQAHPGDWMDFDNVDLVINQDITTHFELQAQYWRQYRDKQVKDQDEFKRRVAELQSDRIERSLAMQAGEDLGASEELVTQQVNEWFEHFVKSRGGIVSTTKVLEADRKTIPDLRQEIRESIFVRLWREYITGEGPGVAKRPQRDRFVRPGQLKFRYNQVINDPGNYGALGGTAETVTLQILLLDPNENGGPEKTNALANELRRRIVEGDDMNEIIQRYGKDKEGMLRDETISHLSRLYPSMGNFAQNAQVDDVSEPMPFHSQNGTFVQVIRLVEKKAGMKPELTSADVQKKLTETMKSKLDEYRLHLAYLTLYETSYVWPQEHNKPN